MMFTRLVSLNACRFASLLLVHALAANSIGAEQSTEEVRDDSSRPNVVFFLVDDLGWSDLGFTGSSFYESPNIDALAASGMRFSSAYAACPVCSPTRASIMTGRHPVEVDITDWIPGSHLPPERGGKFKRVLDRDNLALDETTLAEALKAEGYQTFFAGKWHLGGEGHWPTDQGFDTNIGGTHVGSPPGGYYSPWKNENLVAKQENEYLTERLTSESLEFLEQRDQDRPFLLFLSYYNVHTPITPYQKRFEYFQTKAAESFGQKASEPQQEHEALTRTRQDNPAYASMIAAVDESVGAIERKLQELDLDENTIVCFFSDNGGLSTLTRIGPTCNLPLRAGKGFLYEGGVRVPMIMRVPGVTKPDSECPAPVVSTDFFPTLLELADVEVQPQWKVSGQSMVGLLKEEEVSLENAAERTFYWHYPHYHGSTWKPGASIREGDWKLIEFYHYEKVELYNLAEDPGEKTDLSEQNPEVATKMLDKLHQWQSDHQARMPQPND